MADTPPPLTRDGVVFSLGMPLFTEAGRKIETSTLTHTLRHDTFLVPGASRPTSGWFISTKGSGVEHDLRSFYATSPASRPFTAQDLCARLREVEEVYPGVASVIESARRLILDNESRIHSARTALALLERGAPQHEVAALLRNYVCRETGPWSGVIYPWEDKAPC